ncbi:MAG TPA: hypothetical protein VG759_03195, partial [Candidatus Angelobacter sp.]|nr:hypothetical protein [Candidatus Angelobacter sp.]
MYKQSFPEDRHLAAIKQLASGKSLRDVAASSGVTKATIRLWLNKIEELHPWTEGTADETAIVAAKARDLNPRPPMYSEEFKREIVQQRIDGVSPTQLSRDYQVGRRAIYEWSDRFAPGHNFGNEDRDSAAEPDGSTNQDPADNSDRHAPWIADPLLWLQNHTQTKDNHWREAGARSCYRAFPDKPHFRPIVDAFQSEPIVFVEKSRDMMISWLCVGLFTHAAMTTAGIEVLFQSQKEDKACELVAYAKTLYNRQNDDIKDAYPLKKGRQPANILEFAHGSRIIGIPGGGDQIRSYHPWGLFQDEAAFMPEAGEAYDHAVPVCQKIVVVSSAGPGWFSEQCQAATDVFSSMAPHGVRVRRLPDGRPVYRVHYSADPERDAAWVERERKKYSSKGAWDREQEIIHEAGGGERLFAEVLARNEEKILIDPYTSGFRRSPYWKLVGGFDHGKANPTGALVACIDHDGVIYVLGEYYQPGLSPTEHRPNLLALMGFNQAEVFADPSIFHKTQAQEDGKYRAIAELYSDLGITNLIPAPATHELLGMERILAHWHDLDRREPTLKIVCPREKRDISRP